jgi:hypothetical protein
MAHKPLARFVVECGGELKRLFSVREVSKGSLIITTDAPSSVATNEGQVARILSYKHTVHTSERSETGANLVHMTQEFENGSTKHAHLLTHAVRDGTFAPIYQKLAPDPRNKPSLFPHKKDTVVSLGAFDPGAATLIYGIWLSSAKDVANFPLDAAYSSVVHQFREFSLSIASGFVAEPSSVIGTSLLYSTTSANRLSGLEQRLGYRTGITPGATAEELPGYIVHEMNAVLDLKRNAPFRVEMMQQARMGHLTAPMFSAVPPR